MSKRFGGVHALRGVSLTLHAGEVLALAGDNGAGKSTLIKIISEVYQPDDGTLSYQGKEIRLENPHRARDCGIETIYQDLALEQRKVMELIANLKQSGVGVIFISHNLIDIFHVSDRILVLRRGAKVGEKVTSETNSDEIIRLMVGG